MAKGIQILQVTANYVKRQPVLIIYLLILYSGKCQSISFISFNTFIYILEIKWCREKERSLVLVYRNAADNVLPSSKVLIAHHSLIAQIENPVFFPKNIPELHDRGTVFTCRVQCFPKNIVV